MPQLIVTTTAAEGIEEAVLLRERVSLSDFESDHFCGQLVERIGWAVVDADEHELRDSSRIRRRRRSGRGGEAG